MWMLSVRVHARNLNPGPLALVLYRLSYMIKVELPKDYFFLYSLFDQSSNMKVQIMSQLQIYNSLSGLKLASQCSRNILFEDNRKNVNLFIFH